MNIRVIIKNSWYAIRYIMRYPLYMINHVCMGITNHVAESVSLKHCKIGNYNYIARRCSFYNVSIGNYCCFGPDVHIGGMQHSYWWYSMSPVLSDKCKTPEVTRIGNDVWIGSQCCIMGGVRIGDGAVIGANSFVNKDVEPFAIVAGSPARLIKFRFDENKCEVIVDSEYWEKPPKDARKILSALDEVFST